MSEDTPYLILIGALVTFVVASAAAWATHVVWVIGKITSGDPVTGGEMALGVLGAFMPPIGVIHGVIIWFS